MSQIPGSARSDPGAYLAWRRSVNPDPEATLEAARASACYAADSCVMDAACPFRADCAKVDADPWHGTPGGYTNHHCRCSACTNAQKVKTRERRALVRADSRPPPVHGTVYAYSEFRCRCDQCKAAKSVKAAAEYQRAKVRRAGPEVAT